MPEKISEAELRAVAHRIHAELARRLDAGEIGPTAKLLAPMVGMSYPTMRKRWADIEVLAPIKAVRQGAPRAWLFGVDVGHGIQWLPEDTDHVYTPERAMKLRRRRVAMARRCMRCRVQFISSNPNFRLCRPCRQRATDLATYAGAW